MTVLTDCEVILDSRSESGGQTTNLKLKACEKLRVLSSFAKATCELVVDGEEGDPVRAFTLASNIDALVAGIDVVHRLLRQAVPESDQAVKQLGDIKKGAFRNLTHDIHTAVDYQLPVSWACVPAMRVAVQVLKELEQLASN